MELLDGPVLVAQVSMNLTDLAAKSFHAAFEAGRFYLARGSGRGEASEEEIALAAVDALGLGDPRPFDPRKKVLEYRLRAAFAPRRQFVSGTAYSVTHSVNTSFGISSP